uniref:alpha/beta fold hydrolase n=1 Tax=Candidatus Electronema sp. TaxID=2698783 RepID=UPI004055AB9B
MLMQIPAILAASKKTDGTEIYIGDNGVITAFKGKMLRSDIQVFIGYAPDDGSNYTYTLLSGPSGLSISSEGSISYDVQDDAATESIPLSIRITRKATGKSYLKNAAILVMETDVVASGTIGPEGGQIADEWEDVVLTVPVDAVEQKTSFNVLRAIDEDGLYIYTIQSSNELSKVLDLKLPNPILRKEPQDATKLKSEFRQVDSDESKDIQDNFLNFWFNWKADYVELTTGFNAENRLRNDLSGGQPAHKNIRNLDHNAAVLFSSCNGSTPDAYDADCGGKDPVLFIHGFTLADFSWNHRPGLGGGEDTWGKLRKLMVDEGYAVFEFKWRTNARFVDVAANLADAIKHIQYYSKKKVHVIAHSFGGLVARAYLQNYAVGRPYQDNVQSLITLGTPHSGIFDADGTYHGLSFKKGQDSNMFEGCMQISCQQAGEPTPEAWTIEQMLGTRSDINLSYWFGIDTDTGSLIAKIQNFSGEHGLPVDTLVLMGLPRKATNINRYRTGDGLITYAGQRFDYTWADSKVMSPSSFGTEKVTEKILGVSEYDSNARPGELISDEVLSHWGSGSMAFGGYFHSTAVPVYALDYGAAEPKVDNGDVVPRTDSPHAALTEIKSWLKVSDDSEPLTVTLNLKVVDANTQQPVSGATVYFDLDSTCTATPYFTDAGGNISATLPFYPTIKYTALVSADGYHSKEFDTGYVTAATPELSGTEFGKIELQSMPTAFSTVTSATGRIWMDRNLGALITATSMTNPLAYGDLYQWGRKKDGHEERTNGTTSTLSSTDNPGHNSFITSNITPYDWRSPQNNNLWQGTSHNPCPDGFRLPTKAEWQAEINSWSSINTAGAFASPLKLPATGARSGMDGTITGQGVRGLYWTSTSSDFPDYNASYSYALYLDSNEAYLNDIIVRAAGAAIRCIKDDNAEVPTVVSATGRIWMDRNLGASRVATSMTDTEAYGFLYQWGRGKDGHEKRTSDTTTTLSSIDVPGHDKFILAPSAPNDWRSTQNNNLWQDIDGINNPCPSGFRVPTADEWQQEINSWKSQDDDGAYGSPLKLVMAGGRSFADGSILNTYGLYWTTMSDGTRTVIGTSFAELHKYPGSSIHAEGYSVRCIKD